MKELFKGFYGLSEERVKNAYKDDSTRFIFDTNILLNLYRCEKETRDQFFSVWESIKDRVWIPFHVALEYQRNRLISINGNINELNDIINNLTSDINKAIEKSENNSNGIFTRYSGLKNELNGIKNGITMIVEKFKEESIKTRVNNIDFISKSDDVRTKIDFLIGENIGTPPKQGEIDEINKEGDKRYKLKLGPGFMDEKDKGEEAFSFNSIEYKSKFGDLYIWKEIINYSKNDSIKNIIYITNDNKDDFIYKVSGKNRGANENLVTEIINQSNCSSFIIHNISSFLHHSKTELNATINEDSINELSVIITSSTREKLTKDIHHRRKQLLKRYIENKIYDIDDESDIDKIKTTIIYASSELKALDEVIEKNKLDLEELFPLIMKRNAIRERLHKLERKINITHDISRYDKEIE